MPKAGAGAAAPGILAGETIGTGVGPLGALSPTPITPEVTGANPRWGAMAWGLAAAVCVIIGWLPFLAQSGRVAVDDDWHFFYHQYEAVCRTIVEYHQFPFWNAWHTGGTPLFGHPLVGVFGIETLLSLLLGTVVGLNLAVSVYLGIGCWGMWLLLADWLDSRLARFWGTVLFGLQGALALHVAAGHVVMLGVAWLPLILHLAPRVRRSRTAAVTLGLLLALVVNGAIHYHTVHFMIGLGCFFCVQLCRHWREREFRLNLLGMSLLVLTLCLYRWVVCSEVFLEFPREMDIPIKVPLWMLLKALVWPGQHAGSFYPDPVPGWLKWHEMGAYVGVIALGLFLFSAFRRPRWWHVAAFITALLAIDSATHWLPGYWLRELPVFKSMWVVTRWRLYSVVFIILGAAGGLDLLLKRFPMSSIAGKVVRVLPALSIAGLLYNQHYQWRHAHWESEGGLLSAVHLESSTLVSSGNVEFHPYAAVHRGVGMLFAYEPLFGYPTRYHKGCALDYRTCRIGVEDPRYPGEVAGLVSPLPQQDVDWSPNRIRVGLDLPNLIYVNQNPGSYWRLNGVQLFPGWPTVAMEESLVFACTRPGEYVLAAVPPGHQRALRLTLAAGFLLLVFAIGPWRQAKGLTGSGPSVS
ncbi:MAG: hypothetical protein A3K19_02100 [Lentisphaerae bacterium RIFOXYB12_FULL_65_16]|nr:MAG: hypothetical protein A3K18_25320 [Lentisphaerae bacterium RIFOXYA12_64_32]OGV92591.1 MAG: hypothetical protein A3K19_02100 [Lentisphaerae bacterium RIFOXYB12_FULL_65_16]